MATLPSTGFPVTAAVSRATATVEGVVQLADAAALTAGTAGRVVDAALAATRLMPLDISQLPVLP